MILVGHIVLLKFDTPHIQTSEQNQLYVMFSLLSQIWFHFMYKYNKINSSTLYGFHCKVFNEKIRIFIIIIKISIDALQFFSLLCKQNKIHLQIRQFKTIFLFTREIMSTVEERCDNFQLIIVLYMR